MTDMLKVYYNNCYRIKPPVIDDKGHLRAFIPAAVATPMLLGVAIAGTVAMGVMGAQAAQQQADAQKKMAEYNAQVQEAEAKARQEKAQAEERRIAKQQKRMLGYQKSTLAKQGFSIEEGTNVDIMADTYGQFASDRLNTLRNGLLEKIRLKSEANMSRMQGDYASMVGRNTATASYLNMGTSLAGTLSTVKWGGGTPAETAPKGSLGYLDSRYSDSWMNNY